MYIYIYIMEHCIRFYSTDTSDLTLGFQVASARGRPGRHGRRCFEGIMVISTGKSWEIPSGKLT